MRKIRDVLRLHFSAELSIRQIHRSTKISVGSIQSLLKQAKSLNLSWPLPDDLDDGQLAKPFYPQADTRHASRFEEPDWAELRKQLTRKGVTKQLLWEEYTQQYPNRCYRWLITSFRSINNIMPITIFIPALTTTLFYSD
jgi:hypothetical protein